MSIIITISKYFLNILVFTKIFGFFGPFIFGPFIFTYKKRIEKAMALKWLQVD